MAVGDQEIINVREGCAVIVKQAVRALVAAIY